MTETNYLAKIGDKVITNQDIDSALNTLDQFQRAQFDSEEGRKRILADLINQELFYLEAKEIKMDEDENFVNEMELIKANMLKQYAINKLISEVAVNDDEMLSFYEENKAQFINPASASAKHILVETEELAKEIETKIKNKEISFEDAAVQYSTCPSNMNGGDLGTFGKGQMVPEFEEVVFTLPINTVSSPVKTQFGYHLVLVTDRTDESQAEYEDVKEDVKNNLLFKKQGEAFVKKVEDLKNKFESILDIKKD